MAITKQEILERCPVDLIASRDCHAIAALMSVDRFRYKPTIIGDGTIIEAFMAVQGAAGLAAANVFLDWFRTEPLFRHVIRLMDRGELRLDKPSTIGLLMQMGADGQIPQAVVQELLAHAKEPESVSQQEVSEALFNDDGSEK